MIADGVDGDFENAFSSDDARFMRRALSLAKRGRTHPNPHVGAIVVSPQGDVVGEGFHPKQGQPHAEAFAFAQAGDAARGGTLYVTLEPCSHRDNERTPCVDRCLAAGVRRVVVAMSDPDTRVSGRGIAFLREKGLDVRVNLLETEARAINQPYIKHRTMGLPHITHKAAMTLDGKIATETGDSRWVSGEAARLLVHRRLRHRVDAIVVGVGTILADDSSLTTRLPRGNGHNPIRVVIDSNLRTPPLAKAVAAGTLIVTLEEAAQGVRADELRSRGVEIVICAAEVTESQNGETERPAPRVDVVVASRLLADRGLLDILLESGGALASSFWRAGLVDRVVFFVAPKVIGGSRSPTPVGGAKGFAAEMVNAIPLHSLRARKLGADILLEGEVRTY